MDIKRLQNEIINDFKNVQQTNLQHYLFGDNTIENKPFNWKEHILKDKPLFDKIIKNLSVLSNNDPLVKDLSSSAKFFYSLGYIPRDGDYIYPMVGFMYHYLKSIKPDLDIEVTQDGNLITKIKSSDKTNKNHILINAHMDKVTLDRQDKDRIWYGAYGKNPKPLIKEIKGKKMLSANNPKSVLGADDGKGLSTIVNLISQIEKNKNNPKFSIPNITFFISSVEEALSYSLSHYVKQKGTVEHLFPKELNNLCFLNLDSFSGREVDIYRHPSLAKQAEKENNWKLWKKLYPSELEKQIIQDHDLYLKNVLKVKSNQTNSITNPDSDAMCFMMISSRDKNNDYLKNMNYFSLAAHSEHPHSPEEEIDLIELDKFNKYFVDLCKSLSKFKWTIKSNDKIR